MSLTHDEMPFPGDRRLRRWIRPSALALVAALAMATVVAAAGIAQGDSAGAVSASVADASRRLTTPSETARPCTTVAVRRVDVRRGVRLVGLIAVRGLRGDLGDHRPLDDRGRGQQRADLETHAGP
jgi:hypothetical protein